MIRRRLLHTLAATAALTAVAGGAAVETLADDPPLAVTAVHAPPLRPTAQIASADAAPPLKPIEAQAEEEERGQELPDEEQDRPPPTTGPDDPLPLEEAPPPRRAPSPTAPAPHTARAPTQPTARAPALPRTGASGLPLLLGGLMLTGTGLTLRRAAGLTRPPRA